jgi:hypothetical protein
VSLWWVSRFIYYYAECHHAECHFSFIIIMLNMLSVVMLSAVAPLKQYIDSEHWTQSTINNLRFKFQKPFLQMPTFCWRQRYIWWSFHNNLGTKLRSFLPTLHMLWPPLGRKAETDVIYMFDNAHGGQGKYSIGNCHITLLTTVTCKFYQWIGHKLRHC